MEIILVYMNKQGKGGVLFIILFPFFMLLFQFFTY